MSSNLCRLQRVILSLGFVLLVFETLMLYNVYSRVNIVENLDTLNAGSCTTCCNSTDTQLDRRMLVRNACRNKNVTSQLSKAKQHRLLVDDHHKALYCVALKAGSTMLTTLFYQFHPSSPNIRKIHQSVHDVELQEQYGLRRLDAYTADERLYRLQNYYKFMFVRHPLTRILSVFRNKIEKKAKAFLPYIPKILIYVKNRLGQFPKNQKVSFSDFLLYAFESETENLRQDPHLRSLEESCSPCLINYDYIGRQETMDEDTKDIIRTVFNKTTNTIKRHNYSGTDLNVTRQYFATVPASLKRKLFEYYCTDAQMFGYNLMDELKPFTSKSSCQK